MSESIDPTYSEISEAVDLFRNCGTAKGVLISNSFHNESSLSLDATSVGIDAINHMLSSNDFKWSDDLAEMLNYLHEMKEYYASSIVE